MSIPTTGIAMWIFLLTVRVFIFDTIPWFCYFYSQQFCKTTPLLVHVTLNSCQNTRFYCSLEKALKIMKWTRFNWENNFMNDYYCCCWFSRQIWLINCLDPRPLMTYSYQIILHAYLLLSYPYLLFTFAPLSSFCFAYILLVKTHLPFFFFSFCLLFSISLSVSTDVPFML